MSWELVLSAATAVAAIAALIASFFSFFVFKRQEQRAEKIKLEMMRMHYEEKIYQANSKMMMDLDRWKDANHLIIDSSRRKISEGSVGSNYFLESLSIDIEDIKVEPQTAFMVAPLHDKFRGRIDRVKLACTDLGIKCETADEKFISGPILSAIVRKILSSSFVIAIIDGRNPNVFYEIGVAQALGKMVLIVSRAKNDVPFDIRSQRMILVDWHDINLEEKIKKSIYQAVIWSRNIS